VVPPGVHRAGFISPGNGRGRGRAVPVPGRTTDGAPAMVPSVPASAVTLKYRENDFQVRWASERGPPRDAATARLSWRKDAARTIDNSRPPYDVLFLFPFLFLFLSLRKTKILPCPNPNLTRYEFFVMYSFSA